MRRKSKLTADPHRYLVADYERRSFSISQCDWNASRAQNIVAIPPPSSPPSQQETPSTESHHVSAILIVVIAICSSIVLVILLSAVYYLAKMGSTVQPETAELDMNASRPYEIDGTQLKQELDATPHRGSELDGRIHIGYEVEGSTDWIAELPAQGN